MYLLNKANIFLLLRKILIQSLKIFFFRKYAVKLGNYKQNYYLNLGLVQVISA